MATILTDGILTDDMVSTDKRQTRMFWIDMEMTGLDDQLCRILEVAVVITDLDLKPIEEFHRVVFQPPEVLARMDEWCTKTHGESGLTAEVAHGAKLEDVETGLVAFARKHFGAEKIVLCGNSVSQDRRFVDRYMPKLASLLHYRLIDVTAFKEVFRNKYAIEFVKKDAHRARDDIFESIAELKHLLTFVKPPSV